MKASVGMGQGEAPTEPEDPTDPTDPTDPVDPTEPTDPTEPEEPTEPTEPEEPKDPEDMLFPNAKIGDYVTFGTYTQGKYVQDPATPIEWQYIANKDGHKMLLSKYALDVGAYNEEGYSSTTWETCSLRKWLNNDFYNTAFSSADKEKIVTSHNENPDTTSLYTDRFIALGDTNVTAGGQGGNPTNDKVFLLSWTEARDIFGGKIDPYDDSYFTDNAIFHWTDGELNPKLICAPTPYADAIGAETYEPADGVISCCWWLRSPGSDTLNISVTIVEPDGELDATDPLGIMYTNIHKGHYFIGIRPVILVD